jgi:peptidoglycan-associated lipoprotein
MMLKAGNRSMLHVVLLMVVLSLFFSGCSSKPRNHWWEWWKTGKTPVETIYPELDGSSTLPLPPETDLDADSARSDRIPLDEIDTTPPIDDTGSIPTADPNRIPVDRDRFSDLKNVYFAFDSAGLTAETKAVLDSNSQWMKDHAGIHVLIEGHCDERGTIEYNLNLGQRRADMVREYMVIEGGLDASTLHTISYGEERPEIEGTDDAAWSQNRRVQFLVY